MGSKPRASVRRPPNVTDLDAFVQQAESPSPPVTSSPEPPAAEESGTKRRGMHKRASGKMVRKISVYLAPDTARALRRYGLDEDLTMSEVVESCVRQVLENQGYLDT